MSIPDSWTRNSSSVLARDTVWILGSILVFLMLVTSLCVVGGVDDSHITFFAARTLIDQGSILNYNGQHIEQSSSLALVLLLAALGRLLPRVSIPTLGWVVSLLSAIACIPLAVLVARAVSPRRARWAAPIVATCASLLFWSCTGMETTFAALCFLLAVLAVGRFLARGNALAGLEAGAALLLAAAVRPEAPIEIVCALLASTAVAALAFVRSGRSPPTSVAWRRNLAILAIAAVVVAGLVAFRIARFGQPLSRPAAVKFTGTLRWLEGARYVLASSWTVNPLLLAAGLACALVLLRRAWAGEHPSIRTIVCAFALSGLAFALASGGDWMPAGRFLLPVLPLFAVAALDAAAAAGRAGLLLALAFVATNLVSVANYFYLEGRGIPLSTARNRVRWFRSQMESERYSFAEIGSAHLRNALAVEGLRPILDALMAGMTETIYLMSRQAGFLPYHAIQQAGGRVRFVDLWCLTTDILDPCLPDDADLPRTLGRMVPIDWFLASAEEIERTCGVPKPHVYFENRFDPAYFEQLRQFGYEIAYTQHGTFAALDGPGARRGRGSIDFFIAVRADVWKELGLSPTSIDLEAPASDAR